MSYMTPSAVKLAWKKVSQAVVADFRDKMLEVTDSKNPIFRILEQMDPEVAMGLRQAAAKHMPPQNLYSAFGSTNFKVLPTSYTKKVAYADRDPNVKISRTSDAIQNVWPNIKRAVVLDCAELRAQLSFSKPQYTQSRLTM